MADIAQLQMQQSSQAGQQAVAENQRRKQQKGGGKSIACNLFLLIPEEYEVLSSVGNLIAAGAHLNQLTSVPNIGQNLKIQTSLWKDGTLASKNDILSVLDHMKESPKEDIALQENQKFQSAQQERQQAQQGQNNGQHNDQHQQQSQQQNNHQNDDSNRNFHKQQQMHDNQQRMNNHNKNSDDFEMLKRGDWEHMKHESSYMKHLQMQQQLISQGHQERQQRKQRPSMVI